MCQFRLYVSFKRVWCMFRVSRLDKLQTERFLFYQFHVRMYARKKKIMVFVLKNAGVIYVYNFRKKHQKHLANYRMFCWSKPGD